MYRTASHPKPQGFKAIAGMVEEAIGPELWAKLIAPRRNDTEDALATRLHAMAYRACFDWATLPAWRASLAGVCDCPAGRDCITPGKHLTMSWREEIIPTTPTITRTFVYFLTTDRNLSILTGKRSNGLVVGDVDPRHGGTLEALWERGWPKETPIERTGGGGWHVYCRADDLRSVPNYGPGLEVKANGALVIASPSLHVSGRRYGWLPGLAPWEVPLATLPDSVVEDIRTRQPERTASHEPVSDGTEANWYYNREETVRLVNNLLNKAIRTADLANANREHRKTTAFLLGFQLGSLGLSDDEITAVGAAYSEAVGDE